MLSERSLQKNSTKRARAKIRMAVPSLTYLSNLRPKLALVHGIATMRVLILAHGRGGLQRQCPSWNISQGDTGQYEQHGTRGFGGR